VWRNLTFHGRTAGGAGSAACRFEVTANQADATSENPGRRWRGSTELTEVSTPAWGARGVRKVF